MRHSSPMLTRHSWLAGLLALGALFCHSGRAATEYAIDPTRTLVSFEMRSLGTTQRGQFSRTAGIVTLDSAQERVDLAIVIDARSLTTASAATANFVRGPSMLNIAAHPEIEYRARQVVLSNGRPARIEGELTLRGVTRPVSLEVSRYDCSDEIVSDDLESNERCALVATANLKRSEFGMTRYMLFASDDVKLAIEAEGVRRVKM
jgi:polyisoprenoid-binding protein YceI